MTYSKHAQEVYERFRQRPGSQHIATHGAIEGLIRWLSRARPSSILEVGAGIGTLTYAAVETLNRLGHPYRLTCLEDNAFCLEQLRNNLAEHWRRFEVYDGMGAVPADRGQFDFIILDGGSTSKEYFQRVAPRGVVFVEGWRLRQR